MLDELSLASVEQMRVLLEQIKPDVRVLVIGYTCQHWCVDAGQPFQQMQEAGMQTAKLSTIVRQKDPELLHAIQHLAANETDKRIALLTEQGSPGLNNIPHNSVATVLSTASKQNLLTVRIDATQDVVTYKPAQFRNRAAKAVCSDRWSAKSRKGSVFGARAMTKS